MRKSHAVGLLFLATATLAQQQQPVEITSEPTLINNTAHPMQFVTVEFKAEKQAQ